MSNKAKKSVGENPVIDPKERLCFLSNNEKLHLDEAIHKCMKNPPVFKTSNKRIKNKADSISCRKKGNELYTKKGSHGWKVHKQILELYTKSIVLAPNKTEELALAYGNRSALLYHLKEYEDCIKDCDRALNITTSDSYEVKILFRKSDCLEALNHIMAKYTSREAIQLIERLTLDEDVRKSITESLDKVKNTCLDIKDDENRLARIFSPVFTRLKEAPCASDAVTIQYTKKWGRHIVARRKIEPGEIIAVEKNYYTFINPLGFYLYCSNFSRFTWSSIPCEKCIYGVYCSETCRADAWKKFHQFECDILPVLWHYEEIFTTMPGVFRFLLIAVHEAGGIQALKKQYMNILKHKDPRTRGFFDGVFRSDKCRSLFSFMKVSDNRYDSDLKLKAQNAVITVYLLAKYTTFFGTKCNWFSSGNDSKRDIYFIGALLTKIHTCFSHYALSYNVHYEDSDFTPIGLIFNPFCGLFNHSCDQNVNYLCSKNQETIIYAKYPINKGEQLFLNYYCNFLEAPKEKRQAALLQVYNFQCKCQPCNENWSDICLPFAKDITNDLDIVHKLYKDVNGLPLDIYKMIKDKTLELKPETLKEFRQGLINLAKNLTIHCEDYRFFEHCIFTMYNRIFGFESMFSDKC